MKAEIFIQNGNTIYQPTVIDGITWTTERKGSPGKLTFSVINDDVLNITEGNWVKLLVDDQNVFYGYIFKKSRSNDNQISITAYDQLRYFKNKDTYKYTGKTASQFLQMLCADFHLHAGEIDDTGYIIPKRYEDNLTLFDMVQNAIDETMINNQKLFVMYDDFGAIALKNVANLKVPIQIDAETGQSFEYTSSIDDNTYNQVKLIYDNKDTGKIDIYMEKSSESINNWGLLQFFETLSEGEDGAGKAIKLLEYYNKKTRNLKISGCFGDIRVRAGTSPLVSLNLGDMQVNNFMLVASATHHFENEMHTMDLTLEGGEFIA